MSLSKKEFEKAKRLEEEILQLKDDIDKVRGYSTRVKGDTFWVVLDGGVEETLRFPPDVTVEVVTALYAIYQRRYHQSKAEFDKLVTPEE